MTVNVTSLALFCHSRCKRESSLKTGTGSATFVSAPSCLRCVSQATPWQRLPVPPPPPAQPGGTASGSRVLPGKPSRAPPPRAPPYVSEFIPRLRRTFNRFFPPLVLGGLVSNCCFPHHGSPCSHLSQEAIQPDTSCASLATPGLPPPGPRPAS